MATNIYGSADTQEKKVEGQATQEVYDQLMKVMGPNFDPGFKGGFSYGAMDPMVRNQYLNAIFGYGTEGQFGPSSQVPQTNTTSDFAKLLSMFGGGSGSGSGSGRSSADVSWAELQYQKKKDAAAKAQADAANQALLDYYSGGAYTSINPEIMASIANMANKSSADVGSAYDTAIENIGKAYTDALGLSEQGYSALEKYLTENPNDPYAGLTPTLGSVTNPMEALLSAYGVGAEPVRAQVQAEQLAGQQGGQAFQDLINVLSKASKAADISRMAESKMGREASKRTLGAQKAGALTQAEATRAQALAQIAERQRQQEFEQQQAMIDARNKLEAELIAAGILPPKGSGPGGALTELEQAIRAGGGTSTEAQFNQGISDLAAALARFQPQA